MMRVLRSLLAMVCVALPIYAQAQEPIHIPDHAQDKAMKALETKVVTVMGVDVEPMSGLFVVTNDVNVRKGPDTKFKRVKGLKKGTHVRAIGKPKGTSWIAVSQDGETLGFVFSKMLMPVVDGTLDEQFIGSFASAEGVACDYRFRFERKVKAEGASFDTADYEVRFRCASSKGAASFYAHMFLTEGPVITRKGLHLIGLDVRSIGDGIEKFLSTRYFYDPKTGIVTFNGHSLPRFATPPKTQKFQTTSVKDALKQTLEASIDSWTPKAWETLFAKVQ